MERVDISVVCTTFNDKKEIRNLIEDFLSQKLLPSEFVVADGGSKDETLEIVKEYLDQDKFRIKVISGKRLNISQGFNEAIINASCPFVVIAGTGNRYDKLYLSELWKVHQETNADIVFAPIRGMETTPFSVKYNTAFLGGKKGNRIPSNHGALIKKSVFSKIGLFYECFIYAGEDAEFYDRARSNGISIACADKAVLEWDVPKDWVQFKKQIKNYTIAAMQIDSNSTLLKRYMKNIVLALSVVIGIAMSLAGLKAGILLSSVAILAYLLKGFKIGFEKFYFSQYRLWYQMYIILKNLKLLTSENKVNSEFISFLGAEEK